MDGQLDPHWLLARLHSGPSLPIIPPAFPPSLTDFWLGRLVAVRSCADDREMTKI
jgi:hypothetical protein